MNNDFCSKGINQDSISIVRRCYNGEQIMCKADKKSKILCFAVTFNKILYYC